MANRNVDKGREAENAAARIFRDHGLVHAERRSKRGGMVDLECSDCSGVQIMGEPCAGCEDTGVVTVPADAGDLTGIPGVVVQVKWSGYKPLSEDMRRTDEQRQVANAEVGLLVRKRPGVGCNRAELWDAYLPQWQVARLLGADPLDLRDLGNPDAVWHTDLGAAAALIATAYTR